MNTDNQQQHTLTKTDVQHQACPAQPSSVGPSIAGHNQSEVSVSERLWPLNSLCWAAFLAFALTLVLGIFTQSLHHTLLYDLFISVFFSGAMIGCYLQISPRNQLVSRMLALSSCDRPALLRFALGPGFLAFLLATVYCYWRFEAAAVAEVGETISLSSTVGFLLLLVVVGPLFEEILFRQLLLQTFIEKFGAVWPAVLCSALVFAAVHSMSAERLSWFGVQLHQLLIFMAALLLSWIRLRYNSLWPAIVLHVAYNLGVALMSFYLASS